MFLRFTDHEGDPLALTPEIDAVYLTSTKDKVGSSFMGREPVMTMEQATYTVIHHKTGNYRVRDSFEDVLAKLDMAREVEALARTGD